MLKKDHLKGESSVRDAWNYPYLNDFTFLSLMKQIDASFTYSKHMEKGWGQLTLVTEQKLNLRPSKPYDNELFVKPDDYPKLRSWTVTCKQRKSFIM